MRSEHPFIYRCSICGEKYEPVDVIYTCNQDGGNLDILLNLDLIKEKYGDGNILKSEPSLWRYLPLLPVSDPGCWGRLDTHVRPETIIQITGIKKPLDKG